MQLENELLILERYKLEPTELFTIKVILLAQIENQREWLQRFSQIVKLRPILESLREKGIILKSWKAPKANEKLEVMDIPISQNFQKNYFRESYQMGEELFNVYPQTTYINNQLYNLRSISHKFDSLEEAFAKYGKYIHYKDEIHQKIIELVKWGIDNGFNFTTLDRFIVDRAWLAIKAVKENNAINVNTDAIKLI